MFKYTSQSINYVECHDNMTFYDKAVTMTKDIRRFQNSKRMLADCDGDFIPRRSVPSFRTRVLADQIRRRKQLRRRRRRSIFSTGRRSDKHAR
ncbi:MAG: hypothetical protein MZU97_24055 [Bacillus subtilis]|nr:hypothetical protein [Bacillus subtilis]